MSHHRLLLQAPLVLGAIGIHNGPNDLRSPTHVPPVTSRQPHPGGEHTGDPYIIRPTAS